MSRMLFLDKLIHKKNYEEIQERVARSRARGCACDQFLFPMRSTCLCLIHALTDRRTMASTNYPELWWTHRFYSIIVSHQVISQVITQVDQKASKENRVDEDHDDDRWFMLIQKRYEVRIELRVSIVRGCGEK